MGIVYLLDAGDTERLDLAIAHLEKAYSQAPNDPAQLNDLAAALMERAGRLNQPLDLVTALELVTEALKEAPEEPVLLFNRALLLEKLQLFVQAREAWDRYINSEPGSPWVKEAQAHIAGLKSYLEIQAEPAMDYLKEAAEDVNVVELTNLAERYPREAREFALEVVLTRWGEATLAVRQADAERWLSVGHALGKELARLGGDRTVLEAVGAIEALDNPREERNIALAHVGYGQGHRLFQLRDYARAAPLLSQSLPLISVASPVAGWVRLDLGAIELHSNQNTKAAAMLSNSLSKCEIESYPALCGRSAWALGLSLFRLGHLPESLGTYRVAAAAFVSARELDNYAAVLGLIAEALRELGDTREAWNQRYRGLRVLGGQTHHRSSHNLLWGAGDAALEEGYPLVADSFANEDVALFGRGQDSLLALESLFRRAVFRRGRVPSDLILADLNQAVAISRKLPISPLLTRIEADIQLTLAEMAAQHGRDVKGAIEEALTFFRLHGLVLREAATLLIRARIHKAAGDITEAIEDLESALELFEDQRERLDQGSDRRLYSDTWQGVYDELMELLTEEPDGIPRALWLLERSRDGSGSTPHIESSVNIILVYAVTSTVLYRFYIKDGDIQLERFAVRQGELENNVRRFTDALRFGSNSYSSSGMLARLLIPAYLPVGSRLCFVPDRELSGVPFAALPSPTGSDHLLNKHEVMIGNSVRDCASADPHLQPLTSSQVVLAGAPQLNPMEFHLAELQGAAEELAFLKELYPRSILLVGNQATASALAQALPHTILFHFAGHAVAHPTELDRSFIPLAPEPARLRASLISVSDIAQLNLSDMKLAVLSACDSLTPRPRRAEGISGLVRALLDAGSEGVVGALWQIDDDLGRVLMIEFHRQLRKKNGDIPGSLRAAQLSLINHPNPRFRNPGTWAAFELIVKARQVAGQ